MNAFFADYALSHFTTTNFEAILSKTDSFILVSENGVGIDGFVQMALGSPAPVKGCSDLEIAKLYVQPRHQGSGAGGRLLAAALQWCASTDRPDVWLAVNAENTRATDFYLKKASPRPATPSSRSATSPIRTTSCDMHWRSRRQEGL